MDVSTSRSGSMTDGVTRLASTMRNGRSTRCARTSVIFSGRGSCRRNGGRRRRDARRRRAPVGMGYPDDGPARGCVQPPQLSQRHSLASRHGTRGMGARPDRIPRCRARAGAQPARGGPLLRVFAPGGVRGLQPQRDRVSGRLSHGRAAAGVGCRRTGPVPCRAARPPCRASGRPSGRTGFGADAGLARGHTVGRRARLGTELAGRGYEAGDRGTPG